MRYIVILCFILSYIVADETIDNYNIDIWNHKEEPKLENDFIPYSSYRTNSVEEAIGITLMETIFHLDKVLSNTPPKSKPSKDEFKELEEFEKSIHDIK